MPIAALLAVERRLLHVPAAAFVFVSALASLALASAGAAVWSRHAASGDRVFADLMLWGWIRRKRADKRIADARALLASGEELTSERRVEVLWSIARTIESRDPRLHGHSTRVARIAEAIALKLSLEPDEVARVRTAAAVHDVGKLRTPWRIVNKPGPLTDAEFEVVKRHPVDGAKMVELLGDEELTAIVRHHHERLDGRGYPEGICGREIPIGARIIAVADTFDAITSTRPYRRGRCHREALDVLRSESGTQLDPRVVGAFVSYYNSKRAIFGWGAAASAVSRAVAATKSAVGGLIAGASIGQGVAIMGAATVVATATVSPVVSQAMPGLGHHAKPRTAAHGGPAARTSNAVSVAATGARGSGPYGPAVGPTGPTHSEQARSKDSSTDTDSNSSRQASDGQLGGNGRRPVDKPHPQSGDRGENGKALGRTDGRPEGERPDKPAGGGPGNGDGSGKSGDRGSGSGKGSGSGSDSGKNKGSGKGGGNRGGQGGSSSGGDRGGKGGGKDSGGGNGKGSNGGGSGSGGNGSGSSGNGSGGNGSGSGGDQSTGAGEAPADDTQSQSQSQPADSGQQQSSGNGGKRGSRGGH